MEAIHSCVNASMDNAWENMGDRMIDRTAKSGCTTICDCGADYCDPMMIHADDCHLAGVFTRGKAVKEIQRLKSEIEEAKLLVKAYESFSEGSATEWLKRNGGGDDQ
jgi:hypothetical protein